MIFPSTEHGTKPTRDTSTPLGPRGGAILAVEQGPARARAQGCDSDRGVVGEECGTRRRCGRELAARLARCFLSSQPERPLVEERVASEQKSSSRATLLLARRIAPPMCPRAAKAAAERARGFFCVGSPRGRMSRSVLRPSTRRPGPRLSFRVGAERSRRAAGDVGTPRGRWRQPKGPGRVRGASRSRMAMLVRGWGRRAGCAGGPMRRQQCCATRRNSHVFFAFVVLLLLVGRRLVCVLLSLVGFEWGC